MAFDPDLAPILADFERRISALEGSNVVAPVEPEPEPIPAGPEGPVWDLVNRSQLSLPDAIDVPAGDGNIYIPVSVDHTNRESFYCYVNRLINVSGGEFESFN